MSYTLFCFWVICFVVVFYAFFDVIFGTNLAHDT